MFKFLSVFSVVHQAVYMHTMKKMLKGPGSIRPIFGLKNLENFKLFIVIEYYSKYKE